LFEPHAAGSSGQTPARPSAPADVPIAAADITLISGFLAGVVTAIRLSRAMRNNICQRPVLNVVYNGVAHSHSQMDRSHRQGPRRRDLTRLP
jgi:hypothetical protein